MKECKFCKKNFKKNYDLIRHESICKDGDVDRETYTCSNCSKTYKTEKYYNNHMNTCMKKYNDDAVKDKIKLVNAEIRLKKLEIKLELLSKPNITNNNTINITNNISCGLLPIDLSMDRFNDIVIKNYTEEVYNNEKIVDKVVMVFLRTDEGEKAVVLTDRNRMTLKCLDKNTGMIVKKDPSDIFNICQKSEPMKERTSQYEDNIMTDMYGNRKDIIPETAIRNRELLSVSDKAMYKAFRSKKHMFNQSNKNNEDVVPELQ